jgi:hypothetical protein
MQQQWQCNDNVTFRVTIVAVKGKKYLKIACVCVFSLEYPAFNGMRLGIKYKI